MWSRPSTGRGRARGARARAAGAVPLAASLWLAPAHAAEPAGREGDRAGATGSLREADAPPEPQRASAEPSNWNADRVVARWTSSATGGTERPQFILARPLAFEARLEAASEGFVGAGGYADKHVRAAMQRHVTETMLAALPVDPAPTPKQIATYAHAAQLMAEQRAGGPDRLRAAARAEGLDSAELDTLWRRRARASAYLDRMVAPMLEPTDADLREAYNSRELDVAGRSFTDLRPMLRRTVVARRVAQALDRYFRNAQSRIVLQLIPRR